MSAAITRIPLVVGVASAAAYACRARLYAIAEAIVRWVITKRFFSGFQRLSSAQMAARREERLEKNGVRTLPCSNREGGAVDALYVRSLADRRTGHVVVFCLNSEYQNSHPRHQWPFLENGADVVLWNPTKLGSHAYAEDLSAVLQKLRADNPEQKIVVKTYCASSEPSIKALAELQDPEMHLIVDRGHGNVQKLARSSTVLAKLPMVQRVLQREFSCDGEANIQKLRGRILFLTPHLDQVMDYGKGGNLTRDLAHLRQDQPVLEIDSHDHWSSWDAETLEGVLTHLQELGVVQGKEVAREEFPKVRATYFQKKCLPRLIKSCC